MRKLTIEGKAILASALFAVLLYAAAAHACTAFFKYERTSGMNKICVYNHLGSDYAITVSNISLCPLNIQVPH
jgi:hypothetical protein